MLSTPPRHPRIAFRSPSFGIWGRAGDAALLSRSALPSPPPLRHRMPDLPPVVGIVIGISFVCDRTNSITVWFPHQVGLPLCNLPFCRMRATAHQPSDRQRTDRIFRTQNTELQNELLRTSDEREGGLWQEKRDTFFPIRKGVLEKLRGMI